MGNTGVGSSGDAHILCKQAVAGATYCGFPHETSLTNIKPDADFSDIPAKEFRQFPFFRLPLAIGKIRWLEL